MSSSILFLAGYIVLSSAKFACYTCLIKENKLFIRTLDKMGPNKEPCGISDKNIWKAIIIK